MYELWLQNWVLVNEFVTIIVSQVYSTYFHSLKHLKRKNILQQRTSGDPSVSVYYSS